MLLRTSITYKLMNLPELNTLMMITKIGYGCQQHFGTRITDVVVQTMGKEIEEQKLKINDHGYLKENINTCKIRKKKELSPSFMVTRNPNCF